MHGRTPIQKKEDLSLSLSLSLFSSFLFFSPSFSLSLFSLLLYFYSSCYLPSVFCLLSAVAVTFVIAIVSTADAHYLPANLRQGANFWFEPVVHDGLGVVVVLTRAWGVHPDLRHELLERAIGLDQKDKKLWKK